jgi:hypothetical protein
MGLGCKLNEYLVSYIGGRVIKWLVLRIGGSKLYEEKAVPFVGGFILGAALNALVAGIGAYAIFRPI